MSRRFIIAIFKDEGTITKAVRALRADGLSIADVFSPYAVHGLNEAMDLPPSSLPWVPLIAGIFGCAVAMYLQLWVLWIAWPLNVGGKPGQSWLAYVPISFEMTVLFAGISSVIAFFWKSKLFWGAKPNLKIPGVTDDKFALALDTQQHTFEEELLRKRLLDLGAVSVEEKVWLH